MALLPLSPSLSASPSLSPPSLFPQMVHSSLHYLQFVGAAGETHGVRQIMVPSSLFPLCISSSWAGASTFTVSPSRPVHACCNFVSEMFILRVVPDPSPPKYWRYSFPCLRRNSPSLSNLLLLVLSGPKIVGGGKKANKWKITKLKSFAPCSHPKLIRD